MDSDGILKGIDDLKMALKGNNGKPKQDIDHLGHEINGKLDSIVTDVQGLQLGEGSNRGAGLLHRAAEETPV